jgi:hypothetical protein
MRRGTESEESISDAVDPLGRLLHRNRHYHQKVARLIQAPLGDDERFRILQKHCSKRGRRHDFSIVTRTGLKCLWCGITQGGNP